MAGGGRFTSAKASGPVDCCYCEEECASTDILRMHIDGNHPRVFQCKYVACGYRTEKRASMKSHMERIHEKDPVSCTIIGCGFVASYTYMKRHITAYHADILNHRAENIDLVGREGSVEDYNSDTQSTSTGFAPSGASSNRPESIKLPCPTCRKQFWTRRSLTRHIARVHEKRYKIYDRVKKYACQYEGCGKAYTTPGKLKDHETSHTDEKPFECGRCNKSFSGRAPFADHLRRYHAISIKDVDKLVNLL